MTLRRTDVLPSVRLMDVSNVSNTLVGPRRFSKPFCVADFGFDEKKGGLTGSYEALKGRLLELQQKQHIPGILK